MRLWMWWPSCILVFGLFALGCSDSGSVAAPTVYPVHGSVTVDGQPTQYVRVGLLKTESSDEPPVAIAMTDENGAFSFKTVFDSSVGTDVSKLRALQGVEPGEYFLSFSYLKPIKPNASEAEFGPELLQEKYQKPQTSNLPELRITINAEDTELQTIDLKRR